MPLAGLAALRTLGRLQVHTGQALLILNGSGGVGRFGIQHGAVLEFEAVKLRFRNVHNNNMRALGKQPERHRGSDSGTASSNNSELVVE